MDCIKCGKKLKDQRVFCSECLAEAEKYPVEPGTPILLPRHTPYAPQKKRAQRKRQASLTPEEQLQKLRSAIRMMVVALIITFLAFLLMAFLVVMLAEHQGQTALFSSNAENVSRETIRLLCFSCFT